LGGTMVGVLTIILGPIAWVALLLFYFNVVMTRKPEVEHDQ
jgi:hypothetical protein